MTAPGGDPAALEQLATAVFGAAAVAGLGWGAFLRARRPHVYATIGLGAHTTPSQATPDSGKAPA